MNAIYTTYFVVSYYLAFRAGFEMLCQKSQSKMGAIFPIIDMTGGEYLLN